jgi:hypothetical protein
MARDPLFLRRQIAARRLFLDGRGKLNRDAQTLAVYFRRLTAGGQLTHFDNEGRIDPVATVAAAQRREVWDAIVRLLNLEPYETENLRDEE